MFNTYLCDTLSSLVKGLYIKTALLLWTRANEEFEFYSYFPPLVDMVLSGQIDSAVLTSPQRLAPPVKTRSTQARTNRPKCQKTKGAPITKAGLEPHVKATWCVVLGNNLRWPAHISFLSEHIHFSSSKNNIPASDYRFWDKYSTNFTQKEIQTWFGRDKK